MRYHLQCSHCDADDAQRAASGACATISVQADPGLDLTIAAQWVVDTPAASLNLCLAEMRLLQGRSADLTWQDLWTIAMKHHSLPGLYRALQYPNLMATDMAAALRSTEGTELQKALIR